MTIVCCVRSTLLEKRVDSLSVRVKLFPYSDFVAMNRPAALHLFKLLQRYNWSLEDPTRYQDRWAAFWPCIDPVERQLLYIFVMTNNGGEFGRRLEVINPPIEFEPVVGELDRSVFNDEIKSEFRRLLSQYFSKLIAKHELLAHWNLHCKSELLLLEAAGLRDLAFDSEIGLHGDLFKEKCALALEAVLPDLNERLRVASVLTDELQSFIIEKEQSLWSGYSKN